MNSKRYKREAEHGGSWYQSDPNDLNKDLSGYLQKAEIDQKNSAKSPPIARGIIAPHAGFSYSGPTAGYAYNGLKSALEKGWQGTVLVLHPSHHVYLEGCAISGATSLETPLGDLSVDDSLRSELLNTGEFTVMDKETDENEHSGEMQYPFIAKTFLDSAVEASNLLVLPIMVGAISNAQEAHFGRILSKFVARENVFTVISSDFCHWGARFGYTPTKPPGQIITSGSKEIYEYVEWMDHLGMDHIASQEPGAFAKYIKQYKNTICGRHPIAVYMSALNENTKNGSEKVRIDFVKYAQSSHAKTMRDSSVSYASAISRKVA